MNIFKQLFVSLYSPKAIASFREQGMGKTILYVFLLSLLSVLPSAYFFSTSMMSGLNAIEETMQSDIPPFSIENGELHVESDTPITINNGELTIIFDGTGTIDQSDIARAKPTIFFLKNELTYTFSGQSQSFPYSMLGDTTVSNEDLIDMVRSLDSLLPVMLPITFLVMYLFSTAMKFITVAILALLGLAFRNLTEKPLQYGHLFRIAAYSTTLPTVFFIIMDSLQTIVPNGFIINWFVAVIIIMLAIKEIKSESIEQ